MRSDIHEPGRGYLPTTSTEGGRSRLLPASVVDAALGDDPTPVASTASPSVARRHVPGAEDAHIAIDEPHRATAPGDGSLLRQLSRQLALLEDQQRQIRQLLEQTERRYAARDAATRSAH